MKTDDLIDQIAADNRRGAASLAKSAAQVLLTSLDDGDTTSITHLKSRLDAISRRLVRAQPAMGSIFNLANSVLLRIEGIEDIDAVKATVRSFCQDFAVGVDTGVESIAKNAIGLIRENATIMTHSSSSTVSKALLFAHKSGRGFEVICTESRPGGEGIDLARSLGAAGIRVKLIVDAMAFSFLPETHLLLVGADAISPRGVFNKIGTSGLVAGARLHGIECYALCGLEKFVPRELELGIRQPKDPREVYEGTIRNVEIVNRYFDVSNPEHFAGIVTSEGIVAPDSIDNVVATSQIHRALLSV